MSGWYWHCFDCIVYNRKYFNINRSLSPDPKVILPTIMASFFGQGRYEDSNGNVKFQGSSQLKSSGCEAQPLEVLHMLWLNHLWVPRIYTYQFGLNLIEAMKWHRPRATMRQKARVDTRMCDSQIFNSLPILDVWEDAQLFECYSYLRGGNPCIPDSWQQPMAKLDQELASMGFHH